MRTVAERNPEKVYKLSEIEVKAIVRYRDGYCCTECGMTAEEHFNLFGKTLDVHRLVPGSPYTVDGCVTLCRGCHSDKPKQPRGTYSGRTHTVRLTLRARELLEAFRERTGRSFTDMLELALEEYAKSLGIVVPSRE